MKDQLLLIVLLLAVSLVESLTAVPDIASLCQISEPWQMLPHEHHCQRFYVCTGDPEVPFQEFSCPLEYHFSRELKICVPGTCSDDPPSPICGLINHVERVSHDCSRYMQCLTGGAYAVAKCSAGNYFDPNRKACLPVAVTAAHQCSCVLPDNATLANSNDCETYFRCKKGEAVLVQCPPGEYFEAEVGTCLPDLTGICLERPTMPPQSMVSAKALALDECIRTGSRLAPHRRDCQRYYICARMRVIEMRCPRGQYFDVVHRLCSLDRQSECNVSTMVENKQEQPKKEDQEVDIKENELDSVLAEDLSLPGLEANAKQPAPPPNERDVVSNYDKFSSKFVSL
ncbi:peritrophin-48 [Drosophila kikkawai]|uniref:Peritrophin-48 n=1 Tax=Drosophila kikkawai TaxID=30033 RepID=A0A6P4I4M9_DROKI|nr:peritrophin-48 [Drosophila kikkawai]